MVDSICPTFRCRRPVPEAVHCIPPASPQHNGRHERMHRTMKAATGASPAANRDDPAGAVRYVPRTLQRGAPARGARANDACVSLAAVAAADAGPCARAPGTMPGTRSGRSAQTARSVGRVSTSSSARRWRASPWASASRRPATSCGSAGATWDWSVSTAGSCALLRRLRRLDSTSPSRLRMSPMVEAAGQAMSSFAWRDLASRTALIFLGP